MLPIFLYINPYICYTRSEIRLLTKEVLAIIDMITERVLDLIHDPSYKPLKKDELAKVFVEHHEDKEEFSILEDEPNVTNIEMEDVEQITTGEEVAEDMIFSSASNDANTNQEDIADELRKKFEEEEELDKDKASKTTTLLTAEDKLKYKKEHEEKLKNFLALSKTSVQVTLNSNDCKIYRPSVAPNKE